MWIKILVFTNHKLADFFSFLLLILITHFSINELVDWPPLALYASFTVERRHYPILQMWRWLLTSVHFPFLSHFLFIKSLHIQEEKLWINIIIYSYLIYLSFHMMDRFQRSTANQNQNPSAKNLEPETNKWRNQITNQMIGLIGQKFWMFNLTGITKY